jgi:hypothetical protein
LPAPEQVVDALALARPAAYGLSVRRVRPALLFRCEGRGIGEVGGIPVNHSLSATRSRATSGSAAVTKTGNAVARTLLFGAGLVGLHGRAGWPS